MSYQVLARKWRPQNFKQMVGQEHVLKALIHALDSQRLHHAYLFTGTRGVGKTTIGRILAKCLSCDKGITSEPCGTCGACTSIVEGRYVDLIEIDAASRTKVEDMRELLDNVPYAPAEGRFKIYLIDEVHMLSQSSFNALLKTLEEPPEHVKFLFATTDPQKLPVTILSRCLQFNLKNMSPEKIVSHLQFVLSEEQVQFEDNALWALARAADGSMRDALSLTDQAIAYSNRVLSEVDVSTMLGTVDQKKIYRILDCLVNRNAASMLQEVSDLAEFSPDYASVLAALSEILHRVAVEQAVPGSCDNAMGDKKDIIKYAQQICAEDVQLFYQISLVSRQDLSITPDPKSGLEMALLRMMAFQLSPVPNTDIEPLPLDESTMILEEQAAEEQSREEQAKEQSISEGPALDAVKLASSEEVLNLKEDDSSKKKTILDDELHSTDVQLNATCIKDSQKEAAEKLGGSSITEEHISSSSVATNKPEHKDDWNTQVTQLGLSGFAHNLLLNSVVEINHDTNPESSGGVGKEKRRDCLNVYLDTGHYRLLNANHEKRIRDALLNYFDQCSEIEFFEGLKSGQESPAMWRVRINSEKLVVAKDVIKSDSNVQQIVSLFDGRIVEESIQYFDTNE